MNCLFGSFNIFKKSLNLAEKSVVVKIYVLHWFCKWAGPNGSTAPPRNFQKSMTNQWVDLGRWNLVELYGTGCTQNSGYSWQLYSKNVTNIPPHITSPKKKNWRKNSSAALEQSAGVSKAYARPSVEASRRSTTQLHFQQWSRVCSFS